MFQMGRSIALIAADGHHLAAYQAMPTGLPRGAVVVIQEIFGVNDHIRKVADGLATDGYSVIAPALFARIRAGIEIGYSRAKTQEGFGYKTASRTDKALLDIEASPPPARLVVSDAVGTVTWRGWPACCRACFGPVCCGPLRRRRYFACCR